MATENVPSRDSLFAPWIINFASVATANATLLNLTVGQAANLTAHATLFETAFEENNAAKTNAKGKATVKRNIRKASEELFRGTAKVIAANGNIDPELKAELGINTSPSSLGPVVPVTDLAVAGFATGTNKLSWKRNGNADGTTFLIEARYGESAIWTLIDVATSTRYNHTDQTPGVQVQYRIISQRAGIKSDPSNEAVVYGTPAPESVSLKLAA